MALQPNGGRGGVTFSGNWEPSGHPITVACFFSLKFCVMGGGGNTFNL